MALSLTKTGITTGNTVEAFHVTQSIDAFTGTEAYNIILSGSLQVTGSVAVQGLTNPSQDNILTYDTTTGQIFYTASSNLTTQIDTGSFVTNSQTGSFVTNSQTGSFVTNSQTSSFVTSTNTGSFLISASSISNTIHFTSSNGNTFNVTVDTGSSGGGGMTWQIVTAAGPTTIGSGNQGFILAGGNNIKLALPASSNVGDTIEVISSGSHSGYSRIEAGTGQIISAGGLGSSLSGQLQTDANKQSCYQLVCTTADVAWRLTRYLDDDTYDGSGNISDSVALS